MWKTILRRLVDRIGNTTGTLLATMGATAVEAQAGAAAIIVLCGIAWDLAVRRWGKS